MKINEVFEGLASNPKAVYQVNCHSRRYEMFIGVNGFIELRVFSSSGQPIDSFKGSGGFTGNLKISDEWELKRESVDFMTAANSGKRIIPIIDRYKDHGFQPLTYWSITLEQINAKWEIE